MKPVMIPTTDVNSETAVVTAWRGADGSAVGGGGVVGGGGTRKAGVGWVGPAGGGFLRGGGGGGRGVRDGVPRGSGFRRGGAGGGQRVSRAEPLALVFASREALREHAARRGAAADGATGSAGVRATAPALRRAADLGVDVAGLAG